MIKSSHQQNICIESLVDRFLLKKCCYDKDVLIRIVNDIIGYNYLSESKIYEREEQIKKYQHRLNELLLLPKIEQKSEEWYKLRNNLITASDFAQSLGKGKFSSQKQFFKRKCGFEEESFDPYIPPLKWGIMYEPIASQIYQLRNCTNIHDFGLLLHSEKKYFGASPDGITDEGIMIEIKCPYKRKITGDIPEQYTYQIQGQLSVCDLQECDYLECEFNEYVDPEEFYNDGMFYEKGVIIEYKSDINESSPIYKYSNVYKSLSEHDKQDLKTWINQESCSLSVCSIHFWRLHKLNVIRIFRDDEFLKDKFTELDLIKDKLHYYKNNRETYDNEIGLKRNRYEFISEMDN